MGDVMRGLLFSLLIFSARALFIPPECRYLKAAQHHATMADVQERLGVPLTRNDTPNGQRGSTKFWKNNRLIAARRLASGATK
jgi:hypothetical protein